MKDLKYICVQPDDQYYTWQVHMWLESLKNRGDIDKAIVLIFTPNLIVSRQGRGIFSILTLHAFSEGTFDSGLRAMSNSSLTGVSGNETGINSILSGSVSVIRTMVVTSPLGETNLTLSPLVIASFLASDPQISTEASGENLLSREDLELLEPVPK